MVCAKIGNFLKKEMVFCVSFCAAAISALFVPPSSGYAGYINTDMLLVLFSLMLVVAGLRSCGIFTVCADFLCRRVRNLRKLAGVLVFLCFLFSMAVTNDVALLTFVPFSIVLLADCGQQKFIIYVVVLQTVAANLGSMLTPMGNPQNLFLYTQMGISVLAFCRIVVPYVVVSALLTGIALAVIPGRSLSRPTVANPALLVTDRHNGINRKGLGIFLGLFILCIGCILKMIPALVLAGVTVCTVAFAQRRLFRQVDYMLLLTFCSFFVFTGNMEHIEWIRSFLEKTVRGHEFLTGLVLSQLISNVPSALLLYPFASNTKDLLLGVDIGGLGTLVASLASLISYKLYVTTCPDYLPVQSGTYFAVFTGINFIYLAGLCFCFLLVG